MTDPLYNQIVEGLNKLDHGNKFQSCAADLLRKDYPGLVPVSGGNDAGVDGAAPSGDGQKIQLICTTQESVITNVGNSLEESKKKGQTSEYVLVATSQALSPPQKRNLEKKVAEFGKTLLPVVDQEAIAHRLYRDPKWLKELLGITGTLPALARVPVNVRPTFDLELVGREEEKKAIVAATRDLVLVGQPGSGKTSLLVAGAGELGAAFLVAADPTSIANAVREQRPKRIVVDDAASRLETLTMLRQLRREIGADFWIIATCWPSQQERVAAGLGVQGEPVTTLEPLPQKTIKQIVNAMKILGPDHLVHEILHQAAGRPGLAVTLCQLCLRGGTRGLFTGEALTGDIKLSFEAVGAEHAVGILGYFALGGEAGMCVDAVATLTGLPGVKLREAAETMSAAGVLQDVADDRLVVEPARLRQALVRDVFFKKAPLNWRAALQHVPSSEATIETIIAAALLGGAVPDRELRPLMESMGAGSAKLSDLCGQYARLGLDQGRWVLAKHPQIASTIASFLLENVPADALPVLLRAEAGVERAGLGRDIELKGIKEWIYEPGDNDRSLPRRELLLKALDALAELKGTGVMLSGLRLVMGLGFEWVRSTPGDPHSINFISGVVSRKVMERIAAFWPRVLALLKDFRVPAALQVSKLVNDWTHPDRRGSQANEEFVSACRVHARQMLADLLAAFRHQWTVVNRFATLAENLGQPLQPDADSLSGKLFPPTGILPARGNDAERTERVVALVKEWEERGPVSEFICEWVDIDRAANVAHVTHFNLSRATAQMLAEQTKDPTRWYDELTKADAPEYLVAPFVTRCSKESDAFHREFIKRHLGHAALAPLAIEQLVGSVPPDDPLWAMADEPFAKHAGTIEWMVMVDRVPTAALEALLTKHGAVARAVAAKLWPTVQSEKLPASMRAPWERAVVESMEGEHELAEIALARPDLAFEWLKRRINRTWEEVQVVRVAASDRVEGAMTLALNREQRLALIDAFQPGNQRSDILSSLIGDDLDLLRHALLRPETKDTVSTHLGLPGDPITHWVERAKLLLEAGHSEADVMWGSDVIGGSWMGPTSRHHEQKRECFARLLGHLDDRIRRIGESAVEILVAERDRELANERRAAVRGELY